ncbi:MAG: CPBP family intramembrane metalloprotease, partial [Chloroflexi bacterium]|nr:CPBP family intramembrane metalloprotease [Chloroflexota bacterium]
PPILWWFLLLYLAPLSLLLPASYIAYRLEGNPSTWAAFKERFNLKPLKGMDWAWVIGLVVFGLATSALSFTSRRLATLSWYSPPEYIPPVVDPRITTLPAEIMGVSLQGNWLVLFIYALALVVNILGEELYMRGYILPRQTLTHGHRAWLVHGILWTLFHFFQRWTYLQILPITLSLSYVAYRTKNTSIAIASHYIGNGIIGMIPILIMVAGLG